MGKFDVVFGPQVPLAHSPTHSLTHLTRNGSMTHLDMRPNLRSSSLTLIVVVAVGVGHIQPKLKVAISLVFVA